MAGAKKQNGSEIERAERCAGRGKQQQRADKLKGVVERKK